MNQDLYKHIKEATEDDKTFKPMDKEQISKVLGGKLEKVKKIGLKRYDVTRPMIEIGTQYYSWVLALSPEDAKRVVADGWAEATDSEMDDTEYNDDENMRAELTRAVNDKITDDDYQEYASKWDGKLPKDIREALLPQGEEPDKTFKPMSDEQIRDITGLPEEKITAGPWYSTKDPNGQGFHVQGQGESDNYVAAVDNENDARFIAAAPELLIVLKQVREDLRMLISGEWDASSDEGLESAQYSVDAIDEVLKKALAP